VPCPAEGQTWHGPPAIDRGLAVAHRGGTSYDHAVVRCLLVDGGLTGTGHRRVLGEAGNGD
jgi:hypothetical protein